MAKRKYDHLFTRDIVRKGMGKMGYPPYKGMIAHHLEEGFNFQIRFTHVSVPFDGKEVAHTHDFDQVMLFVPCSDDPAAYDAETEMYLGEEGEKYIVNETCALFVPAGLMHCPIKHIRVGTPFYFVNCPLTSEYSAYIDGKKERASIPNFNPDEINRS
jgi:hypothetical protein